MDSAVLPRPAPALTSSQYAKDLNEEARVGDVDSTDRPPDRADVARFYAAASPAYLSNLAAQQISAAQGRSLSHNGRSLAVLNMASSDALVVSFATKYHYQLWRLEPAIHRADEDDNRKTDRDTTYLPSITTPCFPSYPSNHAGGSSSAAEAARRVYGAGGHDIS